MALATKGIFIIGAKRTPFCHYGGALRESPASHIFAAAAKNAMQAANLDPALIDNTVVGNVFFLSQSDGGKNARYCGLYSGVPLDRPALCVSKAYGTGIQAVISSALEISSGLSNITLTGGAEIMSSLPMLTRNVRFGTALGSPYILEDPIRTEFVDSYTGLSIQKIAENTAKEFGVEREAVDEYAWHSHLKWKAAQEAKIFDSEIAPLTVNLKKKDVLLTKDTVRTMEDAQRAQHLNKCPAILEDGAIVTEENSSRPGDGAAALIIASETSLRVHDTTPLARVVGWATIGVNHKYSGLAMVEAVKTLVKATGDKLDDIDMFEINENFASETLVTIKILNIEPSKVNINGGAVTVGDPVAATGARLIAHLVHQLRQRNLKRGIAVSNCGGGQGVAVMLENSLKEKIY